jgi:hypothetical protein
MMGDGKVMTGRDVLMQIDTSDERTFHHMVQRVVAMALQNQDGRWRTESHRDARDVAEVACHLLMKEIKDGLISAEKAQAFAKGLKIFPDAQGQG